jgi:hypothetical protein
MMIRDPGSTFWIRNTASIYITPSVYLKSFKNVCFRGIEKMVVNAASIITRARGSDLVVKIKTALLQSDHPTAVNYMCTVDAIRQLYRQLV